MSEGDPITGRPHDGREHSTDQNDSLPGEWPASDEDREVSAPESRHSNDETASRAPEQRTMPAKDTDKVASG